MTITASMSIAPLFTAQSVRDRLPLPAGAKGLCPVGDHRVELGQERASQQRASLLSSRSVSNGPGQANE